MKFARLRPSSAVFSAFIAVVATETRVVAQDATTPFVETISTRVDGPVNSNVPIAKLDELDREFAAGDAVKARAVATSIIDAVKSRHPNAYDYRNNYLSVVWTASDAAGARVVRRLVVPQPGDRPHALDLPGVNGAPALYEIFLAADSRATLVTVYRSTREEDPLLNQIPDVAQQIIGPLFGLIAGVAGEVLSPRAKTADVRKTVYVTASRVILPFRRATVQARTFASVPTTPERLKIDADVLAVTLRLKDVAGSAFAQTYADRLAAEVSRVADTAPCPTEKPPAVQCLRAFDAAFTRALADCAQNCVPGSTPSDADGELMKSVDGAFREFVLKGGDQITSEFAFRNQPPTHFSFGAATGLVLSGSLSKPRVKTNDDGVIVADPLGRLLTMIVLNWSPRGFDAASFQPSKAERYRLFAGAVITPDFGVGGGLSVLLVRGLAVNVGTGVIWSRAVDNQDAIGKPPADASDPFELGVAPIVFVGASFNMK